MFCYYNLLRPFLYTRRLIKWGVLNLIYLQENGTRRCAWMEITDRVALIHCVRFLSIPRKFGTFVGSFVRVIGATLGYAHRCIREEKCNNELSSRGEHWSKREKKIQFMRDRRENSQNRAKARSWVSLGGWNGVVDSPDRSVCTKHSAVLR